MYKKICDGFFVYNAELFSVLQELSLGKKLGSGGQATVYEGTWLGTPVAIKMLEHSGEADLSKIAEGYFDEYNAIK